MDKPKEEKKPKPRAEKYDAKLAIKGSLDNVVKAAFIKPTPKKK